jgi:hypothetical protein
VNFTSFTSGTPFTTVDPALKMFDGTVPNIGAVNGLGSDLLNQTQTTNDFSLWVAIRAEASFELHRGARQGEEAGGRQAGCRGGEAGAREAPGGPGAGFHGAAAEKGRIKGHRLRVQGTGGLSAPPRESGGPVNRRRFGRGSGSTRRRVPGPFGHPQAGGRHLDRLPAAPEGARRRRPEEFKGARGKGTSCVWKRVKE